jgi:hypothetical protein
VNVEDLSAPSADDAPPPTETVAAKLFRDELALLDEMAAIAP